MQQILLGRHGQAYVNKGDIAAFGNIESPLTERGIEQSVQMTRTFRGQYGIDPSLYDRPVLASEYVRPQQTAQHVGFVRIDTHPIINEADVESDVRNGVDVIAKHTTESWVPEEVTLRAQRFLQMVRDGELEYEIFFTHGMFIAAVLLELDPNRAKYPFDPKRGFIPLQAAVVPISV